MATDHFFESLVVGIWSGECALFTEGGFFEMIPEETQTLLELARWTATHRNKRHTIRELAGTEENYQLFIRELDRIESQGFRARTQHAEVSLTLLEWLEALNYFYWRCAYCQERPFQIMSYHLPILQGGMTALNCLPACYRCRHSRREENKRIQGYFARVQASRDRSVVDPLVASSSVPFSSDRLSY